MFKTLNSKIDAKNAFVQSNVSNLIKRAFKTKTMQKTLKMLSKKTLQIAYFTSRNLYNFSQRSIFSYC
jgi:uncharacterized radical SAM superfamily Fe-S cluster-containing enzyme